MKKFLSLLLTVCILVFLVACGTQSTHTTITDDTPSTTTDNATIESSSNSATNPPEIETTPSVPDKESVDSDEIESEPKNIKKELTENELNALLAEQDFRITSTKYVVQHEEYKARYPDMLQVLLYNGTEYDIKNAVVAFVAWDKNNLPVKIKGSMDFSDGAYIKTCSYSDINLVPGDTYGSNSGMSISEDCKIKKFKAIVVSYEAFSGETWTNPLCDDWLRLYEGVKLQ